MSNLDGLAMLGQQRAKASRKAGGASRTGSVRRTLPPRHPAPAKESTPSSDEAIPQDAVDPAATSDTSGSARATHPVAEASTPQHATRTSDAVASTEAPSSPRVVDQPLIRSTLYVDTDLDAWLQTVAGLGRSASPRVDITRSAVVRFALERLRADLTATEIFEALVSRAADATSNGGRKRI